MKCKGINVKFLEGLLVSIVAIFAPIKMMIITTGILIAADLITGMLAARKRGEKITSAGIRRTTSKSAVYLAAICLGFMVEVFMIDHLVPISKIVSGLIGITEIKSVFENLDVISGNPILKQILAKLGSDNDKPKDEEKKD